MTFCFSSAASLKTKSSGNRSRVAADRLIESPCLNAVQLYQVGVDHDLRTSDLQDPPFDVLDGTLDWQSPSEEPASGIELARKKTARGAWHVARGKGGSEFSVRGSRCGDRANDS